MYLVSVNLHAIEACLLQLIAVLEPVAWLVEDEVSKRPGGQLFPASRHQPMLLHTCKASHSKKRLLLQVARVILCASCEQHAREKTNEKGTGSRAAQVIVL